MKNIFYGFIISTLIFTTSACGEESVINYTVAPEIYDQAHPQQETTEKALRQLKATMHLPKDATIITFNCESGKMSQYIASHWAAGAKVTAMCLNDTYQQFAQTHYGDNTNLSFKTGSLIDSHPEFKATADVIVTSWLGTYIPAEKHKQAIENMYQTLKAGGQIVMMFPQRGSALSNAIRTVVTSDKWNPQFDTFNIRRHNFSNKYITKLVESAGFEEVKTQSEPYRTTFKTENDLKLYIHTAIGRYLPWLKPEQVDDFINDISKEYRRTIGFQGETNIPYKVTMSVTTAKRV